MLFVLYTPAGGQQWDLCGRSLSLITSKNNSIKATILDEGLEVGDELRATPAMKESYSSVALADLLYPIFSYTKQ